MFRPDKYRLLMHGAIRQYLLKLKAIIEKSIEVGFLWEMSIRHTAWLAIFYHKIRFIISQNGF